MIFEGRRYSRMARLLAEDAKKCGISTTLVTDAFCDWGRDLADEIFVVPTEFNLFWESTAQMASLANLLVNGVFIELGPRVEQRMNEGLAPLQPVHRLCRRFIRPGIRRQVVDTFLDR